MAAAAEGKYVIGAAQRLGCVAATEVGGLVADARQRLGCMVAAEQLGWVARLDSTHTLVCLYSGFLRAVTLLDTVEGSLVIMVSMLML